MSKLRKRGYLFEPGIYEQLISDPNHKSRAITDLKKGDRVEHYKFGKGVVVGINVSSYSIPMVTVQFDKVDDKIVRPGGELKKIGKKAKIA